jgi:hypothetical protein
VPTEQPRDFELLVVAAEFVEAGRFDYATIAVQTAVEIYVEQRVRMILAWRQLGPLEDWILKQFGGRPYNFRSDRLKGLWRALTRDEINKHGEWWSRYMEHVQRRDNIVHAGAHASSEQAQDSLRAASGLMNHVNNVMIETGLRLGKLREVGTEARADPDPY